MLFQIILFFTHQCQATSFSLTPIVISTTHSNCIKLKTSKQDQGRTFLTRKPMEALLNMQVSTTRNFGVLWQTKKGNCCL